MSSTVRKDSVMQVLKGVNDPELNRSIVALGMVKNVQCEGNQVFVHLEVTTKSPQLQDALKLSVHKAVESLPGVEKVTVQIGTAARQGASFADKQAVAGVKSVIAVASGKGGVGKTTVAVNLALALEAQGRAVGLMDGDIYGPNVPLMLGIDPETRPQVSADNKMIPLMHREFP